MTKVQGDGKERELMELSKKSLVMIIYSGLLFTIAASHR